jgi:hypothetical protein
MRPRSRAGSLSRAASVVGALVACGQILNVDGIEIVPPRAAGGTAGSVGMPPPECSPGEFRCDGAALRSCDASERAFRTVRVCSSAELCCDDPARCADGQPGCLPPACGAGEFRCQGDALERCNPGQTGFVEVDRCPSALYCDASQGRCTDQPCDATLRQRQCSGASLEECLPGRSAWSPIDDCVTQALCSPEAACAPPACRIGSAGSQPSPYICLGGNLMRCNDGQTGWEYVETCLNTANCNALIGELVGDPYATNMSSAQLERLGCTPPGCTPGRYRCDGATLMLCNTNRTGYLTEIARCDSARQCNASAGRCTLAPCVVGDRQCSGDEYQVCTSTGWELLETCGSGAPCDAASGCQATVCSANEYRCDGVELERCNVARTGWIPVQACETSELCDAAAKRCEPPACELAARRCSPAGVLERCTSGRSGWEAVKDCAAAASLPSGSGAPGLCDPSGEGRCLTAATCAPNSLRCNDAELERCRDNAWHPYDHCTSAAQCDTSTGTCLAALCEPGSFRCVTAGEPALPAPEGASRLGLELQVCNTSGTAFDSVESCDGLELCDDVHGQCDICDPTAPPQCTGNRLFVCTADGQEQTLFKVCTSGCAETETEGAIRTTCREDLGSTPSN